MLSIRLFYDNFTGDDVAGMFSPWHFVFIFIFIASLTAALFASRFMNEKQVEKTLWWIAICVSLAEIIKISLRIAKGDGVDSWIPLYYCSLFLYAVWMSRSRWTWLSRMGYAYITMGGILAACLFTLYPSTSLAIYPALHPASLHSLFYHLVMAYAGLLVLTKKTFKPRALDSALYASFVITACIAAFFINERYGSNCMFLHHAFKLPVLDGLLNYSHTLYMLVVSLGQAVVMYWLNYGLYVFFNNKFERKKQ